MIFDRRFQASVATLRPVAPHCVLRMSLDGRVEFLQPGFLRGRRACWRGDLLPCASTSFVLLRTGFLRGRRACWRVGLLPCAFTSFVLLRTGLVGKKLPA